MTCEGFVHQPGGCSPVKLLGFTCFELFWYASEVFGTNFFNPVPNPGLNKFPNQNQIENRDSDLIQNKTKSKTETQI